MTTSYKGPGFTFSIVRKVNSVNEAVTGDGITVRRKEGIYVPEWGRLVRCASYDNHFIYEDKSKIKGRWSYMCTCGSPAVIVGAQVYEKDASPSPGGNGYAAGELIVCSTHAAYGRHAEGSQ